MLVNHVINRSRPKNRGKKKAACKSVLLENKNEKERKTLDSSAHFKKWGKRTVREQTKAAENKKLQNKDKKKSKKSIHAFQANRFLGRGGKKSLIRKRRSTAYRKKEKAEGCLIFGKKGRKNKSD